VAIRALRADQQTTALAPGPDHETEGTWRLFPTHQKIETGRASDLRPDRRQYPPEKTRLPGRTPPTGRKPRHHQRHHFSRPSQRPARTHGRERHHHGPLPTTRVLRPHGARSPSPRPTRRRLRLRRSRRIA